MMLLVTWRRHEGVRVCGRCHELLMLLNVKRLEASRAATTVVVVGSNLLLLLGRSRLLLLLPALLLLLVLAHWE